MVDPIISPDTRRMIRLPPGQVQSHLWPIRHQGSVPPFDESTWHLSLFPSPLVDRLVQLTWQQLRQLPRVRVLSDMHAAEGWSRLNNMWEGVSTRSLKDLVRIADVAKFVMIHSEHGFTTVLSLDDFFAEDSLLAWGHDGQDLTPEQGFPLRLVVPRLFTFKNAKWVRGIEFMQEFRPGFYELKNPHKAEMRGDPWNEERPKC